MLKRILISLALTMLLVPLAGSATVSARMHFTTTRERLEALNQTATSTLALTNPAEIQTKIPEIISQAEAAKTAAAEAAARPASGAEDQAVLSNVIQEMDGVVASANRASATTGADQRAALEDVKARAERSLRMVESRIQAQLAAPPPVASPAAAPAGVATLPAAGGPSLALLLFGAVAGLGLLALVVGAFLRARAPARSRRLEATAVVTRPERARRGRRRGVLLLTLAAALLAVFSLLPAAGHAVAAASPPRGTIVVPRGSGLMMVDAATGAERQVAVTPSIGVAGHAAWSPDGRRVALSRFGRRPGERIGGSDILVVPADGGPAWPAAEHDAEGVLLRAPAWAHDGSGLYYDYLPQDAGPQSSRVEFATSSGTGAWIVAGPAAWPDISPDGRWLVYARPSSEGGDIDELVLHSLETGSSTILVAGGQFVQLICPRFAPDGSRVAFIGATSRGEEETAAAPLASRLWAAPRAHGPPGDAYLVALDGTGLTRRTDFAEDEPTLAWSPDGAWLAILAGGGLYLVEADGNQPPVMLAPGSFGGIDWR